MRRYSVKKELDLPFLLSGRTGDRNNNFKLIRFVASSLVIFGHCYVLSGAKGGDPLYPIGLSFGHVAVDIFFIISGFLVTGSFFSRKNFWSFLLARILRIFPGLIICVLFCVFIVGWIYTDISTAEYLTNEYAYSFMIFNILLVYKPLQFFLPGVFVNNPYQFAVNGSLWTLPWEIKMYAILSLLKFLQLFKGYIVDFGIRILIGSIAIVFTALYLYYYYVEWGIPHHFFRFVSMFFLGACFWILKRKVLLDKKIVFALLVLLSMFIFETKIFVLLYSIFLPYFVLFFAYVKNDFVLKFNAMGDYSYGLYIYAFPIQQAIASSFPGIGVWRMFLLAFPFTLILSVLSWHFIESPALRLKKGLNFKDGFSGLNFPKRRPKNLSNREDAFWRFR